MSDDAGPLVKFRAATSLVGHEVEGEVSQNVPRLFASVLPVRFQARRRAEQAIATSITKKLSEGGILDDAELAFTEAMLGENVARYARLQRIMNRGLALLPELQSDNDESQTDKEGQPGDAETSVDWATKFREDASLVDDEVLREVYARVLAAESMCPNTVSLRTLGVIRYLDASTASLFGKALELAIDGAWMPDANAKTQAGITLHALVGLRHYQMVTLQDAGLLTLSPSTFRTQATPLRFIRLTGQLKVLRLKAPENSNVDLRCSIFMLTPAGKELARIASVVRREDVASGLVDWLRNNLQADSELMVANLPSATWSGPDSSLEWTTPPTESQAPAVQE